MKICGKKILKVLVRLVDDSHSTFRLISFFKQLLIKMNINIMKAFICVGIIFRGFLRKG